MVKGWIKTRETKDRVCIKNRKRGRALTAQEHRIVEQTKRKKAKQQKWRSKSTQLQGTARTKTLPQCKPGLLCFERGWQAVLA